MALYLTAERIKASIERLRQSRASGGMVNFLILKRALRLEPSGKVQLSLVNEHFQRAIDELTLWTEPTEAESVERPFVDVFGSMNAKNSGTKKHKYRSNGPSDTLRNGAWSGIVEVSAGNGRSKMATLKEKYLSDLQKQTLLKEDRPMPRVEDAAVWYFRRRDVSAWVSAADEAAKVENALMKAFVDELGLTKKEVAILFGSE